jgi:hypothetical protein
MLSDKEKEVYSMIQRLNTIRRDKVLYFIIIISKIFQIIKYIITKTIKKVIKKIREGLSEKEIT